MIPSEGFVFFVLPDTPIYLAVVPGPPWLERAFCSAGNTIICWERWLSLTSERQELVNLKKKLHEKSTQHTGTQTTWDAVWHFANQTWRFFKLMLSRCTNHEAQFWIYLKKCHFIFCIWPLRMKLGTSSQRRPEVQCVPLAHWARAVWVARLLGRCCAGHYRYPTRRWSHPWGAYGLGAGGKQSRCSGMRARDRDPRWWKHRPGQREQSRLRHCQLCLSKEWFVWERVRHLDGVAALWSGQSLVWRA